MKAFNTIGKEEEDAVLEVLRSGRPLSGYIAGKRRGGEQVNKLEMEWEKAFSVPYAIACNSATSGLMAACMAAGVGPMDEVIVPILTMSATAAAPAVLGARIVFADVDEHYCIDPNSVGQLITENTKAVIAVNLFGHPAKLKQLRQMCDLKDIILIEDNAQAIMAKEDDQYTGTIGHIGVFSLNIHKHIQCGEGGVCVTSDADLRDHLRGAVNHGEMLNLRFPGLNLRMTEITAAIARAQLKKLPQIVARRQEIGDLLTSELLQRGLGEKLALPITRSGCEQTYYAWAMRVTKASTWPAELIKQFIEHSTPFRLSRGYGVDLLTLPAFEKFNDITDAKRLKLTKDVNEYDLLLLETCSIDPSDNEIKFLASKINELVKP